MKRQRPKGLTKQEHAGALALLGESREAVAEKLGLSADAVERAEREQIFETLGILSKRLADLEGYTGISSDKGYKSWIYQRCHPVRRPAGKKAKC